MLLHRISIIVDEFGQVAGAVVSHNYDQRNAQHEPVDVGPFDTVEEVLTECRSRLTIQLPLW